MCKRGGGAIALVAPLPLALDLPLMTRMVDKYFCIIMGDRRLVTVDSHECLPWQKQHSMISGFCLLRNLASQTGILNFVLRLKQFCKSSRVSV